MGPFEGRLGFNLRPKRQSHELRGEEIRSPVFKGTVWALAALGVWEIGVEFRLDFGAPLKPFETVPVKSLTSLQ